MRLKSTQSDQKKSTISIEPGQERQVFELLLDEILSNSPKRNDPESAGWHWDWIAHPLPPASPLQPNDFPKSDAKVDQIQIWFEYTFNGHTAKSNRITLNVTNGELGPFLAQELKVPDRITLKLDDSPEFRLYREGSRIWFSSSSMVLELSFQSRKMSSRIRVLISFLP